MNVQEEIKALKERISESEKLLSKLEEEVKKEGVKKEQVFPQEGDEYWYMNDGGIIGTSFYSNHYTDRDRRDIGNFFKKGEQVEFAVGKLKIEAELRKFSRPFVWGKENWYLGMDNDKDIFLEYDNYEMYHGVTYFESKNKVKEAIEAVGEERIKKYIFGVEE